MKKSLIIINFITLQLFWVTSCKKFVSVDPPRTDLIKTTVFINDETARSAVLDIYYQLIEGGVTGFASGNTYSLTFLGSLSCDELINYNTTSLEFQQFNSNSLVPSNSRVLSLWSGPYQCIYKSNAVIEGLASSSGVSDALKKQLEGEAKFIRAFSHFYLVNLFGDIPLILTTDYRSNALVSRTPQSEVYQQIIADLVDAKNLLSNDYSFSNNERVRANKGAATTLLARVHLYIKDWMKAEEEATSVIENTNHYNLVSGLDSVFLKNSSEAILQWTRTITNTWEAQIFTFSGDPANAALTSLLVNAFELGDKRKLNWIGTTEGTATFHYPQKYKAVGPTPIKEYSTVLRLAEQYLIRAEARAQQNKLIESISDVDAIRQRAGVPLIQDFNPTIGQADLLLAIEHERQFELFTEWGHRWLDLKRTDRAAAVLGPVKADWQNTDALYPIPQIQILNDPNMTDNQNPGY